MVGNKHKNGPIYTFPNCNKPMRTQKFKGVLEGWRGVLGGTSAAVRTPETPPVMSTTTAMDGISCVETVYPAVAAHEDIDGAQARQVQTEGPVVLESRRRSHMRRQE
ncbi:hypothetical protein L916_17280 [Phytophthora nicotianae]|uniref:Uncharacterized protein n=1 Tax=Phytophthora nicotianae TaxID=4792 RepID=W2I5L2_PHYNI|nr:hypothetical protein L916_17280 [Phytophthora nicotianae]